MTRTGLLSLAQSSTHSGNSVACARSTPWMNPAMPAQVTAGNLHKGRALGRVADILGGDQAFDGSIGVAPTRAHGP